MEFLLAEAVLVTALLRAFQVHGRRRDLIYDVYNYQIDSFYPMRNDKNYSADYDLIPSCLRLFFVFWEPWPKNFSDVHGKKSGVL